MRYLLFVFWSIVVFVGVSFAGLNARSVIVNYYINQHAVALPLLLMAFLGVGSLLGILAMMPAYLRAKQVIRRHKLKIAQVELELKNLRTLPIADKL